jgi:hypothetical protein
MDPNPIRTDARRARRTRILGPDAACALCGYLTPEALIPMKRTLLEAHHVCTRDNDPDLTVPLCRNCHAEMTEAQRAAGVCFASPPTLLHQLASALASLAAMFAAIGDRFAFWAAALATLVATLDREVPAWRSWPDAQPWRGAP